MFITVDRYVILHFQVVSLAYAVYNIDEIHVATIGLVKINYK